MKLIKTLVAAFALVSLASPGYAQGNVLNQINNMVTGRSGVTPSGLPPTTMDSFVFQAGGMADMIYGDEGDIDIPPLDSFTKASRINAGIFGQRDAGITTGHGSFLPDAWGGDEWTGNEWDMSGKHNYNPQYNTGNAAYDAAQAAAALLARSALSTNTSNSSNTSTANVNGSPAVNFMANPPAWVTAFGQWATQVVPYAVTEGMKPVQDSTNGQLMGWMAPGDSLSSFLSGQTGRLLPGETAAAATMLQNLPAGGDFTL
jgi:hypothetical protein